MKGHSFTPWVEKIPWSRKWQSTLVFLPGEYHWTEESGRLQFMGSDMALCNWAHTERLSTWMNECTLYALCLELTESHFWVVKWYILSYESPPLTAFSLSTRGARMKWFGYVAIGEMAEWAARLAHGQGWCISGPLSVVSSLGMALCIPLFIPQPTSQNSPNFLSILNLCCLSESSSTQDSSILPFKGTFLKILPDKWGAET